MVKKKAVVSESQTPTKTDVATAGPVKPGPMNEKQVDAMNNIAAKTKTSTNKAGEPDPAHYQAIGTVLTLVMLLKNGEEKVVRWTYGKWHGITGKGSRPYCLSVTTDEALKNGANFSMTEILGDIKGFVQVAYKSYHKVRGYIVTADGNDAIRTLLQRAFKPSAKIRDIIEQNAVRYGSLTWSRKETGGAGRYSAYNDKCTPGIPANMVPLDSLPFDTEMLKASAPEWMFVDTWADLFEAIDDNKDIGRYRLDGASDEEDDDLDGLY